MNNEKLIFSIIKKATSYNQDKAWDWEDPAVEPRQEPFAPSSQSFVQDLETEEQKLRCPSCNHVFKKGKERGEIAICPNCGSAGMAQV